MKINFANYDSRCIDEAFDIVKETKRAFELENSDVHIAIYNKTWPVWALNQITEIASAKLKVPAFLDKTDEGYIILTFKAKEVYKEFKAKKLN